MFKNKLNLVESFVFLSVNQYRSNLYPHVNKTFYIHLNISSSFFLHTYHARDRDLWVFYWTLSFIKVPNFTMSD